MTDYWLWVSCLLTSLETTHNSFPSLNLILLITIVLSKYGVEEGRNGIIRGTDYAEQRLRVQAAGEGHSARVIKANICLLNYSEMCWPVSPS